MSDDRRKGPFGRFRIEIDPDDLERTIDRLRAQVQSSFTTGRHTRVRLTYRGKRVAPDIPLAVFLAGEGAAFWLLSPLGAVLVNLGAKAFLDVELIHEADELVQRGLEAYVAGEVEEAERHYRDALARRSDDPTALFHLGTLLRVTGRREEAVETFRRAVTGPEGHPDVIRAAEALDRMTTGRRTL